MAKILVAGGAGFIGSHVVDELINEGNDVVILDNLCRGFLDNVNPKAEIVKGDVSDNNLILNLFDKHKFDYVFHFAAQSAIGLSNFIKRYNHNVNTMGSINLINASVIHDVKCFVFISTIGVYGSQTPPFDEEKTKPHPQDSYSISKYAIELELKTAKRMFDLDYVIFRPYNVYGERQDIGDRYRNVVGIFMRQVLENKPITLVGEGEQKFAFTYVSDISKVIAKSPFVKEAHNEIFNIGSEGEITSLKELAKIISDSMGAELNITHLPKRKEAAVAYSKIEKAKRIFNWRPTTKVKEGIKKTAEWVKKTGVRRVVELQDLEIEKNAPPSWKNEKDKNSV